MGMRHDPERAPDLLDTPSCRRVEDDSAELGSLWVVDLELVSWRSGQRERSVRPAGTGDPPSERVCLMQEEPTQLLLPRR